MKKHVFRKRLLISIFIVSFISIFSFIACTDENNEQDKINSAIKTVYDNKLPDGTYHIPIGKDMDFVVEGGVITKFINNETGEILYASPKWKFIGEGEAGENAAMHFLDEIGSDYSCIQIYETFNPDSKLNEWVVFYGDEPCWY